MRPTSVKIAKHFVTPILLVILIPFAFGLAFGPEIIAGMLPGILVSGLEFGSTATTSG